MATSKKNFNTLRQKPDFLGTRRKSAFYISFSPLLSRVSKLLVGAVGNNNWFDMVEFFAFFLYTNRLSSILVDHKHRYKFGLKDGATIYRCNNRNNKNSCKCTVLHKAIKYYFLIGGPIVCNTKQLKASSGCYEIFERTKNNLMKLAQAYIKITKLIKHLTQLTNYQTNVVKINVYESRRNWKSWNLEDLIEEFSMEYWLL
jgi:hypothetical protein